MNQVCSGPRRMKSENPTSADAPICTHSKTVHQHEEYKNHSDTYLGTQRAEWERSKPGVSSEPTDRVPHGTLQDQLRSTRPRRTGLTLSAVIDPRDLLRQASVPIRLCREKTHVARDMIHQLAVRMLRPRGRRQLECPLVDGGDQGCPGQDANCHRPEEKLL